MILTKDRRLTGLPLLVCAAAVPLIGLGCSGPGIHIQTQDIAKAGGLSSKKLRMLAIDAACRRSLLDPDRRYVVYFRALDENADTAEVQFIYYENVTFDYPRLKIDTRTGEVLEPLLEATSAAVSPAAIEEPIIITDDPTSLTASETSIKALAIEVMAREELPRNTEYNMEYEWSTDGRQLEVWFRPVWRNTESSGVVRMTFSAEFEPVEE